MWNIWFFFHAMLDMGSLLAMQLCMTSFANMQHMLLQVPKGIQEVLHLSTLYVQALPVSGSYTQWHYFGMASKVQSFGAWFPMHHMCYASLCWQTLYHSPFIFHRDFSSMLLDEQCTQLLFVWLDFSALGSGLSHIKLRHLPVADSICCH